MKMLIAVLAVCSLSGAVSASNGQLILSNKGVGLDSPVRFFGGWRSGQPLDGGYQLQLFQVTGGSETAVGAAVTFRTGAGAGYFPNTTFTIYEFGEASGLATFRVKYFDTGTSFDTSTGRGISPDFTAIVNVAPTPPVATINFPKGTGIFVPEPSTAALAALGGAVVFFRRRK